jgi:hypothetical protein
MFQTEYEFTLPLGYGDGEGNLHREGVMRLATAADEILPLKDPRVQSNEAYLIVILLSRVVTRLGSVAQVNLKVIEGLYAADLAYLQELYNRINSNGKAEVPATCPKCAHAFALELNGVGGLRLPPRGAARGGSLCRIPFSLAPGGDHEPGAHRAAPVGAGNFGHQSAHEWRMSARWIEGEFHC